MNPSTYTHLVIDPDTDAIVGVASNVETLGEHTFASVYWFGINTVEFQEMDGWTLAPRSTASDEAIIEADAYMQAA